MHTRNRTLVISIALFAVLALSACNIGIDRNADGSLRAEARMSEDMLQDEISAAIADPLVQSLTADLREGYVWVEAVRKRLGSEQTDDMRFRLDLGASDGHLTAAVSEATLNDAPIDPARVGLWNERIAAKLERAGQRNPDSALQSVSVGADAVTMVWRIETPRSRGE